MTKDFLIRKLKFIRKCNDRDLETIFQALEDDDFEDSPLQFELLVEGIKVIQDLNTNRFVTAIKEYQEELEESQVMEDKRSDKRNKMTFSLDKNYTFGQLSRLYYKQFPTGTNWELQYFWKCYRICMANSPSNIKRELGE